MGKVLITGGAGFVAASVLPRPAAAAVVVARGRMVREREQLTALPAGPRCCHTAQLVLQRRAVVPRPGLGPAHRHWVEVVRRARLVGHVRLLSQARAWSRLASASSARSASWQAWQHNTFTPDPGVVAGSARRDRSRMRRV